MSYSIIPPFSPGIDIKSSFNDQMNNTLNPNICNDLSPVRLNSPLNISNNSELGNQEVPNTWDLSNNQINQRQNLISPQKGGLNSTSKMPNIKQKNFQQKDFNIKTKAAVKSIRVKRRNIHN